MRFFMELSYRGTNYQGWQVQPTGVSVQEVIEKALQTILRRPVGIIGSGRTDTGVHAAQQFAHLDLEEPLPNMGQLQHSLNSLLPADIAIHRIFPVRPDDHARFTATFRYYQYQIIRRKNAFKSGLAYVFHPNLDVAAMNDAAHRMLAYTDFESFSKVKTEVKTFRCAMTWAEWQVHENGDLTFHIKADRFLRGMVRAIVGTLLEVGQGRMTPDAFEAIIQAKDRRKAGRAAPAEGLFLTEVGYPAAVFERVGS